MNRNIKRFLFLTTLSLILWIRINNNIPVLGQTTPTPTPTIKPALEFPMPNPEADEETIKDCYIAFNKKFPLDFIATEIPGGDETQCPTITIWNHEHTACFIRDIYYDIRPIIIIGLTAYAIFTL